MSIFDRACIRNHRCRDRRNSIMPPADRLTAVFAAALFFGSLATSNLIGATIATSSSSFEGIEEPTVLYHPSNGTFTNDSFVNITDQGSGVIRYTLRYQPDMDWWDGDRATTNIDRQRAEVKGLGVHQETDQTFRYSFDWRTDANFIGTKTFCHIFQLKSTDGDSDDPLVTLTLNKNGVGGLRLWSGTASNFTVARNFTYATNTWMHADILITTSLGNTGSVMASINDDAFSGLSNLPVFRPDATDYRPKWGFYRAINTGMFVGTNWIEDRNVTAGPVLPGDFNQNGVVDAADYVVCRNGLGTAYTQADFNTWRTHFGQTAGSRSLSGTNVAEPSPALLLLIGCSFAATRRRANRQLVAI
jgi:hypothetical protein